MIPKIRKRAVLGIVLYACGSMAFAGDKAAPPNTIALESPSMKAGDPLPVDQTQHGWDMSLPLTWKNLPEGTKELALIFTGPINAKVRPFVHWVVYNIPADARGLPQELPMEAVLKEPKDLAGTVQGHTGWGDPGYRGPWPTRDPENQYLFKLYALDADLNLKPGLDMAGLLKSIEGHVIATGEFMVLSKPYGFS